jgi:hypothetical protein
VNFFVAVAPPGVVMVTVTCPTAVFEGSLTVIDPVTTVTETLVPSVPPKETVVVGVKLDPLIVTVVPP